MIATNLSAPLRETVVINISYLKFNVIYAKLNFLSNHMPRDRQTNRKHTTKIMQGWFKVPDYYILPLISVILVPKFVFILVLIQFASNHFRFYSVLQGRIQDFKLWGVK